jgi:hypothetical protein
MVKMKGMGVLPGSHLSYMDHVVPLCQILDIPLLVTDPGMQELVERYYPPMQILLAEPEDYDLDSFLSPYDFLVYVDFFRKAIGSFQFQEYLARRCVRSVMSLHGNPDKYLDMYWLEKLGDEDIVLAYGPQLVELMRTKNIPKHPIITGNYRLAFYQKHASFFDRKLPFQKEKTTLLYAPTWSAAAHKTAHREYYSTFFDVYKSVFNTLSASFQLIVKLHPHLLKTMPEEVDKIMQEYPHVYFLNDFPLIYPLLEHIDLYMGDYSSIGYDFLYYDRPLFFLETSTPSVLQTCGCRVSKEDLSSIQEKCERSTLTTQHYPRNALYRYVFGPHKSLNQLKQEIEDACRYSAL